MKRKMLILFISIPIILCSICIYKESKATCYINNKFSNPVEISIKFDLEKKFNQNIDIISIDSNVEDKSRIVTFKLEDTEQQKNVLYLESFLPNRIKYIDEVQNIDKYKDYY